MHSHAPHGSSPSTNFTSHTLSSARGNHVSYAQGGGLVLSLVFRKENPFVALVALLESSLPPRCGPSWRCLSYEVLILLSPSSLLSDHTFCLQLLARGSHFVVAPLSMLNPLCFATVSLSSLH